MLRSAGCFGLGVATLLGFSAEGSPAATVAAAPVVFSVVSENDDADGSTTRRETLAMQTISGRPIVTIASARGQESFATETTDDGEIALPGSDGGVTCYNMARSLLAAYARHPADPFVLRVAFLGRVVPVPLALQAQPPARDGSIAILARGSFATTIDDGATSVPGGVSVAAKLVETHGELGGAVFDEMSLAGSPPRPLDRNVCTLEKMEPAPATAPVAATRGAA